MKEIELTQGYFALVDDEDYERVNRYKWCAKVLRHKDKSIWNVYAVRGVVKSNGTRTTQHMHRFILSAENEEKLVDHNPDSWGLNNQRRNLRLVSNQNNSHNQKLSIANKSGYKGVVYNRSAKKWQSQLRKAGKCVYLGLYNNPEEAAIAYNAAAVEHFGKFAKLNKW